MDQSTGATSFVALIIIGLVYFLPFLIAMMRAHPAKISIFLVNLVFGWTFIGWFIALIWAFNGARNSSQNVTVVVNSATNVDARKVIEAAIGDLPADK